MSPISSPIIVVITCARNILVVACMAFSPQVPAVIIAPAIGRVVTSGTCLCHWSYFSA